MDIISTRYGRFIILDNGKKTLIKENKNGCHIL